MDRILALFKVKELRTKLLIVAFILLVSRVLASIPVPGVDVKALATVLANNQLLGLMGMLSGGTMAKLSIVMLGLGPYITATIIMQIFMLVFPSLKALYYEEGAAGRAKFNRYSRYLTVPFAAVQAYGLLKVFASQGVFLSNPSLSSMLVSVLVVTAGSLVMVWLGELITEQQIGNGVSLLIFAGIVSALPTALGNLWTTRSVAMFPTYIAFAVVALVVIAGVVLINEGERKVPVSYARQVRGNKVFGGVSSYLPLKTNQAGVIPIIFAASLLMLPQVLANIVHAFSTQWGTAITAAVNSFMNNSLAYGITYFVLIFVFTYFYTAITFDPKEIAKNLQRSGGFIPGIRPGDATAVFLKAITARITLFGALSLGLIAIFPLISQYVFAGGKMLTIGGTGLLIVVSVALETAKQIDSQLTVREYDSIR